MRIAATLALLTLVLPAAAQPESVGDPADRSVVVRLAPRGIHYFTADLDDDATDSGDVSVSRFGIPGSVEFPIGEFSSITIGAEFMYSFYNFDGTGIFDDSAELLDDAYEVGLSATWSSRIDDHWTYFIGGGGRISAEAGADLDDALTGRLFGGVGYRFSDRFVLGGGVAVSTRLEDDALVVPIITAYYRFNERWALMAGGGPAAAGRTLGATLTWQAQPDLGVSLTGAWDWHEFRLDDDGPIPDGVASDSRVDIALGLDWGISEDISLRVETGVSVWQEFEFDDAGGNRIVETSTDPAPFVGASLVFEF